MDTERGLLMDAVTTEKGGNLHRKVKGLYSERASQRCVGMGMSVKRHDEGDTW